MLWSRMTARPDNTFVATMTTIHGMVMMAAIIWPGCHAALKGVKNELIHSQYDFASLPLLLLLPIIVLCRVRRE